jgi:hypothetical protein
MQQKQSPPAARFLPARRSEPLNALIDRLLVRPALRSAFARVSHRSMPLPGPEVPVIWYGNHSSWWDGYVPFAMNRLVWKREAYVMIEHTQLSRYGFFRWAGGFSVDRSNARSAVQSINYASKLLATAKNRALLIYPQGEILANDTRPLRFFSGVGHIVKSVVQAHGACALVPLALRYEFIGEQKPEAFVSSGTPRLLESITDLKQLTEDMEAALTAELDALRADITAYRMHSFTPVLRGGASINRVFDAVLRRGQIRDVGR